MTARRKIVKTRRSEGRLYLSKAQQFCAEATGGKPFSNNACNATFNGCYASAPRRRALL
jgi:hypothetical protein